MSYLLENLFLFLGLFSQIFNTLFFLFQLLDIFNNTIIKLQSWSRLIFLIRLIFINIDNFTLNLWLPWARLMLLLFFLKLIFWYINQIWYVSRRLRIFNCFSCTKTKISLLNSYSVDWAFLYISLFMIFRYLFLLNITIICYIFYSWFINISELEEELFNLSQRLKLNIFNWTIKELFCNFLLFMLLLRRIRFIIYSSSTSKSIMHG